MSDAPKAERGQKKDTAPRTTENVISDIRKNLTAHLAVPPDDVRTLLAEYDKLSVSELGGVND